MASRDTSTAERAGGRLAYGFTDLSGAFPYTSGTELGVILDVRLSPGVTYAPLFDEDKGEVFNVLYTGGNPVLMVRFATQDTDAAAFVWPNTTTDTGDELIDWPGSDLRAGQFVSGSTLLLEPDNGGPALLLYNAIPMVDVNEALRYSFRTPHSYVAMFQAVRGRIQPDRANGPGGKVDGTMSWLEALARDGGAKPQDDDWLVNLTQSGEEVLLVCTLSLSDYLQLSTAERAALVNAAMRLKAAQAAQVGRAARSELGEADVLSELDGGETYDRVLSDQVFRKVTDAGAA